MTRPDSGIEGGDQDGSASGERPSWDVPAGADVVRPGTGVVRPGTGVVRPGTGVVRPGSASVEGAAKAVAAVPDAPEKPLEPIHVVLPVIPVKPVKQGFLDRLVAGKTDAEKAEEAARKAEEAARKEAEAQRKADERARSQAEDAARKEADAQRKADERARKAAEDAARDEAEEREKAEAKASEAARKAEERARKAEEKARRAEEKALRRSRGEDVDDDEYDDDYDDEYDEPVAPRAFTGPAAPPRPAPPPVAPTMPPGPMAPPRPGPSAPPRPGPPGARPGPSRPMPPAPPGRPQRMPERGYDRRYDDRYEDERPQARSRRPWWHWVAAVAALGAMGAGSATIAGNAVPPEVVQYRAGIDIGAPAPLVEALGLGSAPLPTRGGLEATLGPLFADGRLGPDVAGSVVDGETGELLWDHGGANVMTPASTAKVITATAVLATRGPNYQIPTRVVQGANPGEVVIIGGGDPTLAAGPNGSYPGAARLDDLAQQVRTALGGNPTRVLVDSSLFTGPSVHPSWAGADLSAGHNAAITALMTDGARVNPADTGRSNTARHADPHMAAGRQFAQALGLPDLPVVSGSAPAGARLLGEVLSLPIARIVELMLVFSDNVVAELLARQVALAKDLPASFTGAAQAIGQALADLGVPPTAGLGLADGSGLSNDNRVSANQLTAVLARAASPEYPQLRAVLSGLPVAGFYGSLLNRGQGTARGLVRAKTGTLTGVNALAGYVVDADGRLLIFAALANGTGNDWWNTEAALDRIAEGVSHCGCR